MAAFVRPDLDRLSGGLPLGVSREPSAVPGWNTALSIVVAVLAVGYAALSALMSGRETHDLATGTTDPMVLAKMGFTSIMLIGLYIVLLIWTSLIGRSLRASGRPGAHLRTLSGVAIVVMPLLLCAVGIFGYDGGRDALGVPQHDFARYAETADGIRIVLGVAIAVTALTVRRTVARLLTAA